VSANRRRRLRSKATLFLRPRFSRACQAQHRFVARRFGNRYIEPIVSEYLKQISVFAERNETSTWHRTLTQHVYCSDVEWDNCEAYRPLIYRAGRALLWRSKATALNQTLPPGWLLCHADATLQDFYR